MAINPASWSVKGEAYAYRLPTNINAQAFLVFKLNENNIPADILTALKADGGDLRACKDLAGTQQIALYSHEFDKNGEIRIYGRYDNPAQGSVANNIYFFAGNAAANTLPDSDPFGRAGVFANYVMATIQMGEELTGKTFVESGNGIANYGTTFVLDDGLTGASFSPTPGDMLECDIPDLRDYTMIIWHSYRATPGSTAGAALLEVSEQSGSTGSYITQDYVNEDDGNNPNIGAFNSAAGSWLRSSVNTLDRTWRMLALTGDNTTANERAFFINGVEEARSALPAESTARTRLRMGSRQTSASYRADCGLAQAFMMEGAKDAEFLAFMKSAYDDPDNYFLPLENTETLTLTITTDQANYDAGEAIVATAVVDNPVGGRTYEYIWLDGTVGPVNNAVAPNLANAGTLTKACKVTDNEGFTSPFTEIVIQINQGTVIAANYDFNDGTIPAEMIAESGTFTAAGLDLEGSGTYPAGAGYVASFPSLPFGDYEGNFMPDSDAGVRSTGLALRLDDGDNYLFVRIRSDAANAGEVRVNEIVNQNYGAAAGATPYTIPNFDGSSVYNLKTSIIEGDTEDTVTVLLDDVEIMNFTTTFNRDATKAGVRLGNDNATADDLFFPTDDPVGGTLVATVSADQLVTIGQQATISGGASGGTGGPYTFVWRLVKGSAAIPNPAAQNQSFNVATTTWLGLTVSDGTDTSAEVFGRVLARETVQPSAIPNYSGGAVQGVAVDSTGIYSSNSTRNVFVDGIIKRDFNGVVLFNRSNNDIYSGLIAATNTTWKSNDIHIDEEDGIIYAVPTGADGSRALVLIDSTTGLYVNHFIGAWTGFSAGVSGAHTGNLMLYTFASEGSPTSFQTLEITKTAEIVQFHNKDVPATQSQGGAWDGEYYYIATFSKISDRIAVYEPLNTNDLRLVQYIFINTTFTEIEGVAFYDGKYYTHDLDEEPFIFLDKPANNNSRPVVTLDGPAAANVGDRVDITATVQDGDPGDTHTFAFVADPPSVVLTVVDNVASYDFPANVSEVVIACTANDGTEDSLQASYTTSEATAVSTLSMYLEDTPDGPHQTRIIRIGDPSIVLFAGELTWANERATRALPIVDTNDLEYYIINKLVDFAGVDTGNSE